MAAKKALKKSKSPSKSVAQNDRFDSTTIVEGSEELGMLYNAFSVNDDVEIGDILSGSVGVDEW